MNDDTPPAPGEFEWYTQPGHGWYGLDGQPISLADAGELLRDIDKRRVAYTLIPQPDGTHREVSTVFLAFDAGYTGHYAPVLWETMVFANPNSYADLDMRRYSSRAAAERGHREVVAENMPGRADLARYRRIVTARRTRAQRAARRVRRAARRPRHNLPPPGYWV
jgi:hypothetical protein